MCIKIEQVKDVMDCGFQEFNIRRDENLKLHLQPINASIESLTKWRKSLVVFFASNLIAVIAGIYFIGGWMADVKNGIEHNDERIAAVQKLNTPTAEVLNTKIEQCKADQTKTEAQLTIINAKLDRLIERNY
jgi:hypothetical protein